LLALDNLVWSRKKRKALLKSNFQARKVRGPAGIIQQLDPKRNRSGEAS
jgi:hypothetical protein